MSDLKQLSKDAIPAALEKAERYRLLNEPGEAEEHLSGYSSDGSRKPTGDHYPATCVDRSI